MTRPLPPLDLPPAVVVALVVVALVGLALLASAAVDQRRLRRLPIKDQP